MTEQHPLPSLTDAPGRTPQIVGEALNNGLVSRELVPLDCGRFAYNALHSTNLEAHKDHLTAEQARQINEHFNIEVYLGTHGLIIGQHNSSYLELPTQQEYDAAADAVNGLGRGDVLLVETNGFREAKVGRRRQRIILPPRQKEEN